MAYGLPVLHHLLTQAASSSLSELKQRRPLRALILAPTRELALQVSSHLNACLSPADPHSVNVKQEEEDSPSLTPSNNSKGKAKAQNSSTSAKSKGPPLVSVAAIVGGMSAQKQRRIIERGVDVLVATPGRLWDLLQEVSRSDG